MTQTNTKTRILFIPSTHSGGVYFYRCYTPMLDISKRYENEFDITINGTYTFTDAQKDEIGRNYDIVWFHNCLYTSAIQDEVWKTIVYCKKTYGTVFLLDLDDYWEYHKNHPAVDACRFNAFPHKMMINFELFDYVTTTTEYFKSVISNYFPAEKVYVFENAISLSDKQFTAEKTPSNLLRIGLAGGSSHTEDIKQLMDMSKYMTDKQLEQIEFVLCGFDSRGEKIDVDENGKIIGRKPLEDKDNWWVQIEKHFKSKFKNYRRVEAKDIVKGEFGGVYKDIDVLLVPLVNNQFNRCKSELKFIESGFSSTAVIASKVIPYENYGVNNETCLFVSKPEPSEWAKAIKKLLRDKELRCRIAFNNAANVLKYRNIERIGDKRVKFLRKIMSKHVNNDKLR